jgi:hypothetical protein
MWPGTTQGGGWIEGRGCFFLVWHLRFVIVGLRQHHLYTADTHSLSALFRHGKNNEDLFFFFLLVRWHRTIEYGPPVHTTQVLPTYRWSVSSWRRQLVANVKAHTTERPELHAFSTRGEFTAAGKLTAFQNTTTNNNNSGTIPVLCRI